MNFLLMIEFKTSYGFRGRGIERQIHIFSGLEKRVSYAFISQVCRDLFVSLTRVTIHNCASSIVRVEKGLF